MATPPCNRAERVLATVGAALVAVAVGIGLTTLLNWLPLVPGEFAWIASPIASSSAFLLMRPRSSLVTMLAVALFMLVITTLYAIWFSLHVLGDGP